MGGPVPCEDLEAGVNWPPHIRRAGFTVKAAYLCSSGKARDYSEACSMLAKLRRTAVKRPTVLQYNKRLEQLNLF